MEDLSHLPERTRLEIEYSRAKAAERAKALIPEVKVKPEPLVFEIEIPAEEPAVAAIVTYEVDQAVVPERRKPGRPKRT